MASSQFDEAFERRNSRRFYLSIIVTALASQCWPWPGIGMRVLAGGGGVLVGFGIASLLERLAVALYRCPQCKQRIGRSTEDFVRWDKIVLHCPDCGMNWDLGIKPPGQRNEQNDWDSW